MGCADGGFGGKININSNKNITIGACNRAVKRVPRGIVCIGGLASEGVLVVWSCR